MIRRTTLATALLISISCTAFAADWPQWRGPDRDGVSKETGLANEWPAEGPKLLWQTSDLGPGFSSVAVVGDTFYTLGARNGADYLVACSTSDGKEKWATEIGPIFPDGFGESPHATPTVDAGQIFALGGHGTLICANASDGKTLWTVKLQDLGGRPHRWGYSESILVDGDKVICTPGGQNGSIVALDRKTGSLLWQSTDVTVPANYSSAIVIEQGGRRQYVQLLAGQVVGVDADSGKLLWSTPFGAMRGANIPTPIFHNDHVYLSNSYGVGSKCVKLNGSEPSVVYENKVMKNHHGGVIRIGDYLYGYSDGPGWVCQSFATGEMVWAEGAKLGKGSLTAADGKLYLMTEQVSHEKGIHATVAMIRATHEGWQELGRFNLPNASAKSGGAWSHPVVANGKLYVRDHETIYCYDIAGK